MNKDNWLNRRIKRLTSKLVEVGTPEAQIPFINQARSNVITPKTKRNYLNVVIIKMRPEAHL